MPPTKPDEAATIPDVPSVGAIVATQARRSGGGSLLADNTAKLVERVASLERRQVSLYVLIALVLLFLVENFAVVCFILGHVWR